MTYLVFRCEDYYPGGGANDLEGIFESIEEAKTKAESVSDKFGSVHILEVETGEVHAYNDYNDTWGKPEHWSI